MKFETQGSRRSINVLLDNIKKFKTELYKFAK